MLSAYKLVGMLALVSAVELSSMTESVEAITPVPGALSMYLNTTSINNMM